MLIPSPVILDEYLLRFLPSSPVLDKNLRQSDPRTAGFHTERHCYPDCSDHYCVVCGYIRYGMDIASLTLPVVVIDAPTLTICTMPESLSIT